MTSSEAHWRSDHWLIKSLLICLALFLPFTANAYSTNCYEWLQERLGDIPPTAQIVPEKRQPQAGDIAVMFYEKSGLTHYAVVEGVTDTHILVSESNMFHLYKSGAGYRFIPKDYKNLRGFYRIMDP